MVELFLKALFARSDEVRSAIDDLEVLVSDEEKMAITDVVVGMHQLSAHQLNSKYCVLVFTSGSDSQSDRPVSTAVSRIADASETTTRDVQLLKEEMRENEAQRTVDSTCTLCSLRQDMLKERYKTVLF